MNTDSDQPLPPDDNVQTDVRRIRLGRVVIGAAAIVIGIALSPTVAMTAVGVGLIIVGLVVLGTGLTPASTSEQTQEGGAAVHKRDFVERAADSIKNAEDRAEAALARKE